jgi:hypothetical protein
MFVWTICLLFWLDILGLRFPKLCPVALGIITYFLYLMTMIKLDLGFLEKDFTFTYFHTISTFLIFWQRAVGFKT